MSGCFFGPYVQPTDPPVNCPVELYVHQSQTAQLQAVATRGANQIDVTGTVDDLGALSLDTAIYTVDCDGQPVAETHTTEPFHHYHISLGSNALAGDQLRVDGLYAGIIQASVSVCPELPPVPQPSCSGNYDGCNGWADAGVHGDDVVDPDKGGGCNAGGDATSILVGLALFGVSRKRQRRHGAGASRLR